MTKESSRRSQRQSLNRPLMLLQAQLPTREHLRPQNRRLEAMHLLEMRPQLRRPRRRSLRPRSPQKKRRSRRKRHQPRLRSQQSKLPPRMKLRSPRLQRRPRRNPPKPLQPAQSLLLALSLLLRPNLPRRLSQRPRKPPLMPNLQKATPSPKRKRLRLLTGT